MGWKKGTIETAEEREARLVKRRAYDKARPEEARNRIHRRRVLSHKKAKQPVRDFIEGFKVPCACGEDDPCALDFHHRNPKEKKFSISQAMTKTLSLQEIEEEIRKCDILCANCHRKLHFSRGLTVLPKVCPDNGLPQVAELDVLNWLPVSPGLSGM